MARARRRKGNRIEGTSVYSIVDTFVIDVCVTKYLLSNSHSFIYDLMEIIYITLLIHKCNIL